MPAGLLPRMEDAAQKITEGLVKLALVSWLGPLGGGAREALTVAAAFAGLAARRTVESRRFGPLRERARTLAAEIAADLVRVAEAERTDPAAVERAVVVLASALGTIEANQVLGQLEDPGAIGRTLRDGAAAAAFTADPDGRRAFEALVAALAPRLLDLLTDRQLLETAAIDMRATRNAVARLEARAEAEERAETAELERDRDLVRDALRRQAERVELLGLDLSGRTVPRELPLSVAYLPLQVTVAGGAAPRDVPIGVDELLMFLPGLGGRLLVEGLAGMGKTTLLQWIVQETLEPPDARAQAHFRGRLERLERLPLRLFLPRIQGSQGSQAENWRERTAFLLPLRRLEDGRLPGPEGIARLIAQELGLDPSPWIEFRLSNGKALLLLDGVDEVPRRHRRELRKGLEQTFAALPGCTFVVTSRPGAVEDPEWEQLFPGPRLTIRPMDFPEIRRFVCRWHEAYSAACRAVGRTPRHDDKGQGLIEQIGASGALAQLASVPLLCAAICLLAQAGIGELPRRKAELLERLVTMLVHGRDEERLSEREKARFGEALLRLQHDDKLALLERLARLSFDRDPEAPELAAEDAEAEIGEGLANLPARCRDLPARSVLELLAERSGVLRRVGADAVGFVHNLVRAWLAAGRFRAEGRRPRPLVDAAVASDDRDLVPLTAARADAATRGRLVAYLLDRAERPREAAHAHRLRLWALRARESGEVADRSLDERLRSLGAAALAPRDADEAGELAELGEAMLPYLARRADQSTEAAAAAVRCLRLIGGERARRTIETYLDHQDLPVVWELARSVGNPLDVPWIWARVTGQVGNRSSQRVMMLIGDDHLREAVERGLLQRHRKLDLSFTGIRDLGPLSQLADLEELSLAMTLVEDVAPLARLDKLRVLDLSHTWVRDLRPLLKLKSLKELTIDGELVPEREIANFRDMVANNQNVTLKIFICRKIIKESSQVSDYNEDYEIYDIEYDDH